MLHCGVSRQGRRCLPSTCLALCVAHVAEGVDTTPPLCDPSSCRTPICRALTSGSRLVVCAASCAPWVTPPLHPPPSPALQPGCRRCHGAADQQQGRRRRSCQLLFVPATGPAQRGRRHWVSASSRRVCTEREGRGCNDNSLPDAPVRALVSGAQLSTPRKEPEPDTSTDDTATSVRPLCLPRAVVCWWLGLCRAVFKRGVGVAVLSEYLRSANKEVEVWLQVRHSALNLYARP